MDRFRVNCVLGIDPGSNGGIAISTSDQPLAVCKMPKDIRDLANLFQTIAENYRPVAFLEKLSVHHGDVIQGEGGGVNMGKLFRLQKMIANHEHLKALLEASGIPYVPVHAMSWQSGLKLRVKGSRETKAQRKARYADYARALYPETKVTLWNSDALLIMRFGQMKLAENPEWVAAQLPPRELMKLL